MVKKKSKNIVLIIIIIVLFLYFLQQQPFKGIETASIIAFDTSSECESRRQQYIDSDYQCVSPSCITYTQSMVDCIASCYGGRSTPDMVGYPSCLRISESCDSITDSSDICAYYCYYQSCPTPGDIPIPENAPPCNGIDNTELGSAISSYVSGSMLRTDLGLAIQSWVG